MLVHRRSKPSHLIQAGGPAALGVRCEDRGGGPRPYCQRASSGSFSSDKQNAVGGGLQIEANVASQLRDMVHVDFFPEHREGCFTEA